MFSIKLLAMCISIVRQSIMDNHCPSLHDKVKWHETWKCYLLMFPNSNGGVMSHSLAAVYAEKWSSWPGKEEDAVQMSHRYFLAYYHSVVSLMFFHGLTFLQGCLFWLARHLWRVSWFSLWAHSPCPLWFVFLLFSSRPCSKWPVNRVTLGTGLLYFYRSVWTSDIGKPSRYVNMNSYLLVIVKNVIFSSFGIKRPVFINIKCAVAELLNQLLFLWESGSTW